MHGWVNSVPGSHFGTKASVLLRFAGTRYHLAPAFALLAPDCARRIVTDKKFKNAGRQRAFPLHVEPQGVRSFT
jgi:hypothetical protein